VFGRNASTRDIEVGPAMAFRWREQMNLLIRLLSWTARVSVSVRLDEYSHRLAKTLPNVRNDADTMGRWSRSFEGWLWRSKSFPATTPPRMGRQIPQRTSQLSAIASP
jgi:hypothetical protein